MLYEYLDNRILRSLDLHFVQPNSTQYNKLLENLTAISRTLMKRLPTPQPPSKGFLDKSLNNEQIQELDKILGEEYARKAVNLQDRLVNNTTIVENCEPMVELPQIFTRHNVPISLSSTKFHEACGEWAGKERVFWTRSNVANKLVNAGKALMPLGIQLHFEDAFRPIGVQEGLFFRRVKLILQNHPDKANNWEKVWAEARSKTAVTPFMSGHKSGAAVDITLKNLDDSPLPLGNKYPEGGARVAIRFPYLTQVEWSTRQLFVYSMEMAGLRIYPFENWHSSTGDLSAGIRAFSDNKVTNNYLGQYGPIKTFDTSSGEVVPYAPQEYHKPFYSETELKQILLKR